MKEQEFIDIIVHYGYRNQLKKISEEVYELQEAVLDFENKVSDVEHIEEEVADILHLLFQIIYGYGLDLEKILDIIQAKNIRQHERIERGEQYER